MYIGRYFNEKIVLVLLLLISTLSGCNTQENEYKKVNKVIQKEFIEPLQRDLRFCGIKDIQVGLNEIEPAKKYNRYYDYQFTIMIYSASIDQFSNISENEEEAKELFAIMEKMNNLYIDSYYFFEKDFVYRNKRIEVQFDADMDFVIYGKENSYYFDYRYEKWKMLGKNDKGIYICLEDTQEYGYYHGESLDDTQTNESIKDINTDTNKDTNTYPPSYRHKYNSDSGRVKSL